MFKLLGAYICTLKESNFILKSYKRNNLDVDVMWFLQGVIKCHSLREITKLLNETFPGCALSGFVVQNELLNGKFRKAKLFLEGLFISNPILST